MGQCAYTYNASENYQRTKPGMAPETICGARTYPAVDEPELQALTYPDGRIEFRKTGRLLARGYDDPYCPAHGGTPEPPPPPVTETEVQDAYEKYMVLMQRFGAVPPPGTPVPEIGAPPGIDPAVYQQATGVAPELNAGGGHGQ